MKRIFLMTIAAAMLLAGCTKKTETTTVMLDPKPAFTVSGLENVTLVNEMNNTYSMYISLDYNDSTQQRVTLSLSHLPAGITIDTTTWATAGIPPFTTTLTLMDTTASGATPGTYPMTLTVTTAQNVNKAYSFNVVVNNPPSCTQALTHKYYNCFGYCDTNSSYTDSVYNDPTAVNKIWFSNFAGLGVKVYGIYYCNTGTIIIPAQVINGITYQSASGSASGTYIEVSYTANSAFCSFRMQ